MVLPIEPGGASSYDDGVLQEMYVLGRFLGMKSFTFRFIGAVLLSLTLGFISARWAIDKVADAQSVHVGPWATNPAIGGGDADPYTKASIALHGLLALQQSEAVYYFANKDSSGEPLSGQCSDLVKGG